MIPDHRLRALLRDHEDSRVEPSPGVLEDLYRELDRERGRSRLRHVVPWPLRALGLAAAAGALIAAVVVTGLVLSGNLTLGNPPEVGGGVASPSMMPAPSGAPSPSARPTPSITPGPSTVGICALAWDIPPAKGPVQHNLTGYGFAPGREVTSTETAANGEVNTEHFVADASGTVVLGHYFWTDPLGARDRGVYEWVASDGSCTATIRATVR